MSNNAKLGLRIAAFLITCSALTAPANAHDWFTNARNPTTGVSCCNGQDCIPLPDERWSQVGAEYVVRWFDEKEYRIPSNQAQPSQDKQGRAAGCVWGGSLRCFFVPLSG